MPLATINGVDLFYRDEGRGLPVLLLHGFPFTGDGYAPQLAELSKKYRFIVPDHRGFGRSRGSGPASMAELAEDALGLLDHLGIDSAVVGGVSMGGYVAMALLRADAGRVRALVLIDTQAGADDAAGRSRREETAKLVVAQGMGTLVESMLPKLLTPEAPEAVRLEVEAMMRANPPETAADASRAMGQRLDSREVLARFSGPALVVVGEQDPITPPEKARQLAELIPGASLVQIPHAAHLPNLEQPDAFNRALDAFLSTIPAA